MNTFLHSSIRNVGDCVILLGRTSRHLPALPQQFGRVLEHAYRIGYTSLPIVLILSFFIGAVLALQTGFSMRSMPGAQHYLGSIVGLSMCRELGPVMTCFLLSGRVGSAITAELASMKVYQEIDALITMNLSPERILVLPRLAAAAFMVPVLAVFSIISGWFGGMIVVNYVSFIQVEPEIYWRSLQDFVTMRSVIDGLIKAEIFGLVLTLVCCCEGMNTRGGPREIGSAVTRAVVTAMVYILLLDYLVTRVLCS